MVLADALAYAVASSTPDLIVDVATLTGAMKVALGMRTGGAVRQRRRRWPTALRRGRRAAPASAGGGCR